MSAPSIFEATSGGVTAEHPPGGESTVAVAPTSDGQTFNALRPGVVPFACWRAHDLRFDFGSSFVLPGIASEIGALAALIERHIETDPASGTRRRPTLTVFGHADPTGDDEYNKALGGRRAQAIYALLTRRTELWEQLYAAPLGQDQWEPRAIKQMQDTTGQPDAPHATAAQRKPLFLAYMDAVCGLDARGQPFKVEPTDFLGAAHDDGGKADYQSCGEFNPVLVFSTAEQATYAQPANQPQRDEDNAPNRRVLIFLYRPGIHLDPAIWPCPRVKEGSGGCRKRFWSDGEKRRAPRNERREYRETGDTFACRFYDRLSQRSPCERPPPAGLGWLAVRVFFHQRPMRGLFVEFSPSDGSGTEPLRTLSAVTDDDGLAYWPEPMPIGYYRCEVDGQPPRRIATVIDTSEPELLVLPIGRPYLDIDGDRDYLAHGESPLDAPP